MGKLALAGIHPGGTPLGEFADAAWAAQVDYMLVATTDTAEIIEQRWATFTAPLEVPDVADAAPGAGPEHERADPDPQRPPGRRTRDEHGPPTPAEILAWASDPRAQAGVRNLMGSTGGDS